jgi:hypothetical protein
MAVSCRDGSQLPTNRACFDHPQALPLAYASMDHEDPHIPRRKRSKPTELIRPLELLAAANAAAARAAAGGRQDDHEDDYMPDNLSCLAAAAVAESESDAELARAPQNRQQVIMKASKTPGMTCDQDPCSLCRSAVCDQFAIQ